MVLYRCPECGGKQYKEISFAGKDLTAKCFSCGFQGLFLKYWFFGDKKKVVLPKTKLEKLQEICSKVEAIDLVNNEVKGITFNAKPTAQEINLIKSFLGKDLFEW